jgi:hypothetical protein
MPRDRDDPIADTGMFQAFVAKGDAEGTERRTAGTPIVIAVIAVIVIAVVLVWLLAG